MNRKTTGYWIATGLFCGLFVFGGTSHLLRTEAIAGTMASLGYPAYLMTILGTAKLLGVVALLAPGRPLLKEWAYAGFTIDLLGATASHFFADHPISETLRPLAVLLLGAASYSLRPASRRLMLDGATATAEASR